MKYFAKILQSVKFLVIKIKIFVLVKLGQDILPKGGNEILKILRIKVLFTVTVLDSHDRNQRAMKQEVQRDIFPQTAPMQLESYSPLPGIKRQDTHYGFKTRATLFTIIYIREVYI